MALFNLVSHRAPIASSLVKALLVSCLVFLTGCMTPPKIASMPVGTQPEFLYTPNVWEHHEPYDIMRRALPVIEGVNSAAGSISQSMSSAYNIQADHIAAENQRLYQSYQYSNQLYQNALQVERQEKIQQLQALEKKSQSIKDSVKSGV